MTTSDYVDNIGDQVNESPGGGSDIVNTVIDYTLGPNLEAVVLLEAGGEIDAAGNDDNNALIGNSFNNALDGHGGDDFMVGGAGDDIYVVDSSSDEVVEAAGEGGDIVNASIDYTIGPNVELVVLLEAGGSIDAAGSDDNNALVGTRSTTRWRHEGGDDFMVGGAGDDIYVVDSSSDEVVENAGEGADIVNASVYYTIGANVELVVLLGGRR